MDFLYVNGWGTNVSSTVYLSNGTGVWTQVRLGCAMGGKV